MNNIFLTIAIPTFNRAQLLEKQLNNICDQIGNLSIEVLINDNCSDDATKLVAERYIKKYSFVKYFCQIKNIGLDGNVYSCYKNASGQYIWFLSDDDTVLSHTVADVYGTICQTNPSVMAFSFYNSKTEISDKSVHDTQIYHNFDSKNSVKDFFKVIMISTLVLKKYENQNTNLEYLLDLEPTIFPQITLALEILKHDFIFAVSSTKILLRQPGYVTKNFFELYCINPRLAIKYARIDLTDENKLLQHTEQSLREFVKLQILEKVGYFSSKNGLPLATFLKGWKEFQGLQNKFYILAIYLISLQPKSLIYYSFLLLKLLKTFSITKAIEQKNLIDDHYRKNILKTKTADV